ncbi:hypothetical protein EKK58_11535 [Candidatus Dependentiae bacterium]|nr:MAG: hypothetical protein EKK58_11535 [Candidatus Dependentiae bacterium]
MESFGKTHIIFIITSIGIWHGCSVLSSDTFLTWFMFHQSYSFADFHSAILFAILLSVGFLYGCHTFLKSGFIQ